jgi:hypothetical protein
MTNMVLLSVAQCWNYSSPSKPKFKFNQLWYSLQLRGNKREQNGQFIVARFVREAEQKINTEKSLMNNNSVSAVNVLLGDQEWYTAEQPIMCT